MARRLVIVALALLALVVLAQLLIPPIAENRIEDRLTSAGGSADVSLSAFPAARLLFGDGSEIAVTGAGLDLTEEQASGEVFSNLDGYDRVAIDLRDFRAGPFELASFDLTRAGPAASYHLVTHGRTTPADLASFGASSLGLPGGPLLSYFGNEVLGGDAIPIDLDMDVESDGGRVQVVSGGGTVAGIPTGPLAQVITTLVVVRL